MLSSSTATWRGPSAGSRSRNSAANRHDSAKYSAWVHARSPNLIASAVAELGGVAAQQRGRVGRDERRLPGRRNGRSQRDLTWVSDRIRRGTLGADERRSRRSGRPALPLRPRPAPRALGRRVRGRRARPRPPGHRAIVLKSHDSPTASLAWAVQRDVGDAISVFGGICCDREVGGVNPAAVEVALGLGARIVWLPTLSSRQDFENGVAAQLGIPGPGHRRDRRRRRAPPRDAGGARARARARRDPRDRPRERGRALRGRRRDFARTRRCCSRTRPKTSRARSSTAAQCRELADLGAWVELCAMTCIGALATKTVGADGRDDPRRRRRAGHARHRLRPEDRTRIPAAGLQTYADALFAEGLTEAEIRRMACTNPTALLGLDS